MDITLRMLQPLELKAAPGFDKGYIIMTGKLRAHLGLSNKSPLGMKVVDFHDLAANASESAAPDYPKCCQES